MQELTHLALDNAPLPIHEDNNRLWVDARTFHAQLGVGRDFSTWITQRLGEIGAVENEEFIVLDYSPEMGSKWGGKNRRDYWLTLDLAKEAAMLERNDEGRKIRQYFIRAEKKYRELLARMVLPNFSNAIEAARAWADAREAEQRAIQETEQARAALVLVTPKAEQFDALMSADGTYGVAEAAKLLRTGELRLFKLLRDRQILMDGNRSGAEHHNVPYQRYLDAGYFVVITRARPDGSRVTYTTRITPKGLAWIQKGLFNIQTLLPLPAPPEQQVQA